MRRSILTLALLLTAACASAPPRPVSISQVSALPRLKDGTLDVVTLLQWAQDGITADCGTGALNQYDCRDALGVVGASQREASQGRSPAIIEERLTRDQVQLGLRSPARAYVQWLLDVLAKER